VSGFVPDLLRACMAGAVRAMPTTRGVVPSRFKARLMGCLLHFRPRAGTP
jgi:hypothetical protein